MKTGKTIQELAATLQNQRALKADYIAHTDQLAVLPRTVEMADNKIRVEQTLEVDGIGSFDMADRFHNQIGGSLGIPRKFHDRLRHGYPTLCVDTVNQLLEDSDRKRMIRVLDTDARAYLSDRYRRLDNDDLAEAIMPVLADLGPDARFESCEITDARMYIKVVLPRIEAEVGVGDMVQAGVVITNSEVGAGALKVRPMIYRLVCLNGMVVPDRGMRRYHVGRQAEELETAYQIYSDETRQADDKAFFLKVADVCRAAVDEVQFNAIVDQMRDAKEDAIPTDDPVKAVEKLAAAYGVESERGSVLSHLIQGGELSRYGFLNAVTRTANDLEDYDRASELEAVGGEILVTDSRAWGRTLVA